ncbi:MAG: glycosyltransferase family 2 protein [Verrucomicrobiae bacterium]|nr:glycosyltransferase family 2 protein [Verrucomicrobiae bacterium]
MTLPSLSVVVPNYNHGHSLPACLDALLAQSVPPDEIVVIDDGSTDDSRTVIADYARRHPCIRPEANPANRGVVFTMNRGLELARGDYLHFASADDMVLPGLFERSLTLLAAHPRAALSCSASRWSDMDSGMTWSMAAGLAQEPGYLDPDRLVALERAGRLMIVSHSALLKAGVVREFGGFLPDLRWHCDWFLTYAAAFRHGLCYRPEVLSQVHLHGSSYYGSGRRRTEHDAVMTRLLELLHEERFGDVARRIRESGALSLHAIPMLRAMLRQPAHRDFLTARFLRKCLWRQAQVLARRHFPTWLARACIRLFLRPTPSR